jgi:hypothetical protein
MTNNEELVRLRPYDLAGIWGKAFGQIAELWVDLLTSLMELGAAEDPALVGDHVVQLQVPAASGLVPQLSVKQLVGETHQGVIDGSVVKLYPAPGGDTGTVLFDCRVEEVAGRKIRGDRYVGDVVDERGALVKRIALDIGS